MDLSVVYQSILRALALLTGRFRLHIQRSLGGCEFGLSQRVVDNVVRHCGYANGQAQITSRLRKTGRQPQGALLYSTAEKFGGELGGGYALLANGGDVGLPGRCRYAAFRRWFQDGDLQKCDQGRCLRCPSLVSRKGSPLKAAISRARIDLHSACER